MPGILTVLGGCETVQWQTLSEANAYLGQWLDLWHRSPAATPYQHPAWTTHWIPRCDYEIKIFAALIGDKLRAVLPLARTPEGWASLAPAWGGYEDVLVDFSFIPQLTQFLKSVQEDLEAPFSLQNVPWWSPLIDAQAGRISPGNPRAMLRCPEGATSAECLLPPESRAELQSLTAYLEHDHRLAFHIADWRSRPAAMKKLRAISERMAASGDESSRATEWEFYEDVALDLEKVGALRVCTLESEGRTVGGLIGFLHRGRFIVHRLITENGWKDVRAEDFLLHHVLTSLLVEGVRVMDFSCLPNPLIRDWVSHREPTCCFEMATTVLPLPVPVHLSSGIAS